MRSSIGIQVHNTDKLLSGCYFVDFPFPLPFPLPLPLPLRRPRTRPLTFSFSLEGPGSGTTVVGFSCLGSSLINHLAFCNLQRSCLFAM